jgi:hypothetical protein
MRSNNKIRLHSVAFNSMATFQVMGAALQNAAKLA